MNPQNPVPIYEVFPFVKGNSRLATDYSEARVLSATVNQAKTKMDITLVLTDPVPAFEISNLEEVISNEYGIEKVIINPTYTTKKRETENRPMSDKAKKTQAKSSTLIMGRVTKTKPTAMGDITIEHGNVTVKGEVFAVRSKHFENSNSWRLDFDITDYSGSINVTSFMRDENAKKIVGAIKEGMHLTVSGTMIIDKFSGGELVLDPKNIFSYEKEKKTDNSEEKRVELHLHTKMSAMDALTDVSDVITRAAEWGHKAIAITDHGVVHTFPTAAYTAHTLKNKIKVIYGVEGYFRNDIDQPQTDLPQADQPQNDLPQKNQPQKKKKRKRNNHIILLVKNQTGMKNLYKLITKSHLEHFDGRPVIYKSLLEQHREGIIVGSACEAGEVFKAIINKLPQEEIERIAGFYDYLEIMPICNNSFMLYEEIPKAKNEDELRGFNREIIHLGKALNKPVVATGDVHFLEPEHEIYRQILLSSKGFSDSTSDMPLYFRTTDEMLEEFNYLGEETAYEVVVKNPNLIADMCEIVSPLPTTGKLYPPKLEGSANNLKTIVDHRINLLYGENPPEIVIKRRDYELHDILRLNYDVIYMAAQKLVFYLHEQGSRVGSRGSIGSSFVAHLAGITEVNPLPAHYRCPECKKTEFPDSPAYACGADMPEKNCPVCGTAYIKDGFNIPFETFMGFDGDKVPDIDLNIANEHLSIAHKFTSEMFGTDYVFRAGTIGTVQSKNAYKYVKDFLEKNGRIATKAEENRLIQGCVGVKQTTGQHPGGLIVIPQDSEVTDFCPANYPADDKSKNTITLHFEYKFIEDNLIKLDLLGHDNPAMLTMLEKMTGINADDINLGDPDTMSIFSSPAKLGLPVDDKIIGETGSIGIPEFGTSFVRQMLCDTKPENFDMLIRLSGYSHGEDVWEGNAKDLIISKKATVEEVISSRDDIMLYLISQGMDEREAFKISESVRKGKGIPDGLVEKIQSLRVPKWYIDSCNKIEYLFPKAHATAYVMMSFRIAWFKVHKPLEFYSTHFYRRRRFFDAEIMTQGIDKVRNKITEFKKDPEVKIGKGKDGELLTTLEACYEFYMRGFEFTNIDLYESDSDKFLIVDDNKLRPPFRAVSGFGDAVAQSLAENRKDRKFISIDDISAACPGVNKTNLDKLKQLGALRDLPDSSQMSLF